MTILIRSAQLFSDYLGKTNSDKLDLMGVGASISVCLVIVEIRNKEVDSMGVGGGVYMYDVVVKKFTIAISSPGEFFSLIL